ncbi:MAG: hypothetical protein EPO25_09440 [Gammaproteobacteria bacterium]|nr:MAG: hypothetical protein EPO25_09440 [Gammaproteobacteria bacterium]
MEYYYKVKWGQQDEFIALYKKNHHPLLKVLVDAGYALSVHAAYPILHLPESARWDYRVTVVFRDAAIALSEPPPEWERARERLYPDQERFKQEEQRRFELLEAHWDVAVSDLDLD